MQSVGLKVQVDGEAEFKQSLKELESESKRLNSEMKLLSEQFKNSSSSQEANKSKTSLLTQQYKNASKQVDALADELAKTKAKYGENSRQANDLGKKLADAKTKQEKFRNELEQTERPLAEEASGIKDVASSIGFTMPKISDFGSLLKANLASELIISGVKAVADGIKEIATASADFIKSAVNGYSNYQQLSGGIDKLFGDSADAVKRNAEDSYKTAGISANEYLETVTTFSASLISGLGGDTAKAAEIADKAIKDMSDNANTFGSDIGSIANAYKGFAKGNFNMLDNLNLGYAGTKDGMVKLINDSGILKKKIKNLNGISLDQMIDAIHAVQENMEIAGTTASEASGTIEGSTVSMEAAWENFVAGIANPDADMGQLTGNLVDALNNFIQNIVPAVATSLSNSSESIDLLVQQIGGLLGTAVETLIPDLAKSGEKLINGAVAKIGEGFDWANANTETILGIGQSLFDKIVEGIKKAPNAIDSAGELIGKLADGMKENSGENGKKLGEGVGASLKSLSENFAELAGPVAELAVKFTTEFCVAVAENFPSIFWNVIKGVWFGAGGAVSGFLQGIGADMHTDATLAEALAVDEDIDLEQFRNIGQRGAENYAAGVEEGAKQVESATTEMATGVEDAVTAVTDQADEWGSDFDKGLAKGIKNDSWRVRKEIEAMIQIIYGQMHCSRPDYGLLRDYETWMPDMLKGMATGIRNNTYLIEDAVRGVTGTIAGTMDVGTMGIRPGNNVTVYTQNLSESQIDYLINRVNSGMVSV